MNENLEVHPVELPVEELLASCIIRQTRGSGPGGQHRNKVSTAIVITHQPTGITGQASERRSQKENRRHAVHRLRLVLALAVRTGRGPLVSFQPPEIWQNRLKAGRIEIATEHADFPELLAVVLDLLSDTDCELSTVANTLKCSTTQLVRFLGKEPAALKLVNDKRCSLGKRKYRFQR